MTQAKAKTLTNKAKGKARDLTPKAKDANFSARPGQGQGLKSLLSSKSLDWCL